MEAAELERYENGINSSTSMRLEGTSFHGTTANAFGSPPLV